MSVSWSEAVTYIAAGVALIVSLVALWLSRRACALATPTPQMRRLGQRLAETDNEELLAAINQQVESHEQHLREISQTLEKIHLQLRGAVQRIGLQRFNSDEKIGGELSFALAMLDSRNHGFILTSLYSLEGARIFVRGIISGETDHPLLPEEQAALTQALNS